ncbi:hypothetical protein TUMEXPCC7403_11995 [Tumidithrix helvetica PCC 7403]|uniref:alpha-1,2-fucosyltransferase n=1 Tax=Tumidithrix helvetica TaxID=3457545 RepID=UPI003CA35027
MSHKIIVEVTGRIGNQLFVFAFAYALKRKLSSDVCFYCPPGFENYNYLPELVGTEYLESTKTDLLSVGRFEYSAWPNSLWRSLSRKVISTFRKFKGLKTSSFVEKKYFAKDDEVFQLDFPVFLSGWFQNEEYFIDYADSIYEIIHRGVQSKIKDLDEIHSKIEHLKKPTVGISFRRGDYNVLNWTLPISYYERAIGYLLERCDPGCLLLFGDDSDFIELFAERLSKHFDNVICASKNFGDNPFSDLFLLSECDHCIIPNSSFAWWGAWLGDRKHQDCSRIVIAPDNWIGEYRGCPSSNIIPNRWIQISSKR